VVGPALRPPLDQEIEAETDKLRQEGNALYGKSHYQEALEKYRQAYSLYGTAVSQTSSAAIQRNVAQCYWQLGDVNNALEAVLGSLLQDPNNCKAHFRAAECFTKKKLPGFAQFHYEESRRRDHDLFCSVGGEAKLHAATMNRDRLNDALRRSFKELFGMLDVDGDGLLNVKEVARFWAIATKASGTAAPQEYSGQEPEQLTMREFRQRLRRVAAKLVRETKAQALKFKAPPSYKKQYNALNIDLTFQYFFRGLSDNFFHQPTISDTFDQTEALVQSSGLPHEICANIVGSSGPRLLTTINVSLRRDSGSLPVEMLSHNGEEKEWMHEDVCKDVPVSLCLALNEGDLILALKHLNREWKMVETILCCCINTVLVYGASADGWADFIQKACRHFGVHQISWVQCTKEFLEFKRNAGTGDVSTETIAAALSKLRSSPVLAIPRWSELPAEEHWRELPMMAQWHAQGIASRERHPHAAS